MEVVHAAAEPGSMQAYPRERAEVTSVVITKRIFVIGPSVGKSREMYSSIDVDGQFAKP